LAMFEMQTSSSSIDNALMIVARSHGSRCSLC
jgi:hypothetical protein